MTQPKHTELYVYNFAHKWYASIAGQLVIIPQQVSTRIEALQVAQAMMYRMTHLKKVKEAQERSIWNTLGGAFSFPEEEKEEETTLVNDVEEDAAVNAIRCTCGM